MKLVTFATADGRECLGSVDVHRSVVINLTDSDPASAFRDMLSLIDGGPEALAKARTLENQAKVTHDLFKVKLLAPLPRPRRLRDCLAFEMHVRQSLANRYLYGKGTARLDPATVQLPKAWFEKPVYYKGNPFSVVGTDSDVVWPAYSCIIDYELEVAVVTGRKGKDIPKGKGLDYAFGYMIFNDFSARDAQYVEMQTGLGPAKGKDFDTGNAMGPWLVTADEAGDPQAFEMIARINNVEWSRGSSSEMLHSFDAIICHAADGETFYAGEIIGSGTLGGGCGNELGRFMKHGDTIELEVSRLGVLRNKIVAPHVPEMPKLPLHILD